MTDLLHAAEKVLRASYRNNNKVSFVQNSALESLRDAISETKNSKLSEHGRKVESYMLEKYPNLI